MSGWVIRKDPRRLGCEVELGEEEKCFVYLLSLLSSLALYWCNRSYVRLFPVKRNVWVMQTMYLMALSHSVAHGRKMLAFSLQKGLVMKLI